MSIITFFVQNENLHILFQLNVAYLQGYKKVLAAKKKVLSIDILLIATTANT